MSLYCRSSLGSTKCVCFILNAAEKHRDFAEKRKQHYDMSAALKSSKKTEWNVSNF